MPNNTIAIRREDLNKKGERRVALTPEFAAKLCAEGHHILVQPAIHPTEYIEKRAFPDEAYEEIGAEISEDISPAKVIFGLKEIGTDLIIPNRAYLCFSHTHKGQKKNRQMLREFVARKTTLIDYELVTDAKGVRIITAFTYFAGYAGMIESIWALGERLSREGYPDHPFCSIPQTIELQDLDAFKTLVTQAGQRIAAEGTPAGLPPLVTVFLGSGKTSTGAQQIFDLLPHQVISATELPDIFAHGSRNQVYKLVLHITDMFRLKADAPTDAATYAAWTEDEKEKLYFSNPEQFESNLDGILPSTTLLMNCVLWSERFPRLVTRAMMREVWLDNPVLRVIGDISCDPEGAIEFSRDTWVDAPVYVWHPLDGDRGNGLDGSGVAVMAVTNLPCAFSADSSAQFARDMAQLLPLIGTADYDSTLEASGLPPEIQKATIIWQGELTAPYKYMQEYLQ